MVTTCYNTLNLLEAFRDRTFSPFSAPVFAPRPRHKADETDPGTYRPAYVPWDLGMAGHVSVEMEV
jgi:hypothetical protein